MRSLSIDDKRFSTGVTVSGRPIQAGRPEPHSAHEARIDILSMVAHELRNALMPIRLAAAQLGPARVDAERLPRLRFTIEQQVDHMSRLIGDLLDVSRARNGKLRMQCRNVDMVAILARSVANCRPGIAAHAQHLAIHMPGQALPVFGDPTRLVQIFDNLLDNASKYTAAGGEIALSAALKPDCIVVTVADNGIGIAPALLDHIFEPFVQAETAVRFNGVGLGIGLSVVRDLVQAHAGQVSAHSAGPGLGSRFTITLPLAHQIETVPPEEST